MGIPFPIMRYNNQVPNGLGIIPFSVCNAVKSDLIVLCMYYEGYKSKYFDEISQQGLYRFGTPIQFFNIANASITPDFSSDVAKIKYIDLNSRHVMDGIHDMDIPEDAHLFNAIDDESIKSTYKAIYNNLVNNVHYVK